MENYFPILMFVLVGVAVGVLPVAMGLFLPPVVRTRKSYLLMSVALRHSKMRV
jgi:NADH:ubiquinone oxidoreductase subunit 3 (subunit A)